MSRKSHPVKRFHIILTYYIVFIHSSHSKVKHSRKSTQQIKSTKIILLFTSFKIIGNSLSSIKYTERISGAYFSRKKNELLLQTTSQFLTPSTINRIFFSAAFSRCPEVLEYSLVDYIKYVCYARCRVYKLLPRNKMGFYTVHIYKIICNSRCI